MKRPEEFKNIYIHRDPVDMRKQINGLCSLVQENIGQDLMGKNLFIFTGKKRDTIKILYFDRSGFCLWQKRLERDKFIWPRKSTLEIVEISSRQLEWLLEGYDVWKMRPFAELNFEKVS